jgi:hypothetical protein
MRSPGESSFSDLIAEAKARKSASGNGTEPLISVSLDDFHAYMPMHQYVYRPTRELWPAAAQRQVPADPRERPRRRPGAGRQGQAEKARRGDVARPKQARRADDVGARRASAHPRSKFVSGTDGVVVFDALHRRPKVTNGVRARHRRPSKSAATEATRIIIDGLPA